MRTCRTCEFRGYSQDICLLHLKGRESGKGENEPCELEEDERRARLRDKATHLGMKALVGVGAGVLVVTTSSALMPFLGAKMLVSSMAFKCSAGLLGSGAGFLGYKNKGKKKIAKQGEEL